MRRILATLGILFLSLPVFATNLQLTLNWFGANPTTNRTVTLQPMQPFQGNLNWFTSDTNGIVVWSNAPIGLINGVIKAPPGQIQFQVYLTATNLGLVDASNVLATGTATTYPAGGTAWAIATSDQRYQLSGTTLSNTFYPLFSNPSNYASLILATNASKSITNEFGDIIWLNTNQVDLAGEGAARALAATNTPSLVRSNTYDLGTNWLNTNLMAAIRDTNYLILNTGTNLLVAERNALIATQAIIQSNIGASNTVAIFVATNSAWQSFTNAASGGAYAFNLYSATNLTWSSIVGVGTLGQWMGISTNSWNQSATNWTVAYVLSLGYATTNQLIAGTNTVYTNLSALFISLNNSSSNSVSSNVNAFVISTASSLTNLNSATSNQLAGAQSAGTNSLQAFVAQAYTTTDSFKDGTNRISTNSLTAANLLFITGTNYANTYSSAVSLAQGAANSNQASGLFNFSTNYTATNALALATANTNYTRSIGIVVTNLSEYVQVIESGVRLSVLVSSSAGTANARGTNLWASATLWTNINGLSFITNDADGSRIYVSGIAAYGFVSGYPFGATTNLGGSSPSPTASFLPQSLIALTDVTNIANTIYSNNLAGYVTAAITNGLGGGTDGGSSAGAIANRDGHGTNTYLRDVQLLVMSMNVTNDFMTNGWMIAVTNSGNRIMDTGTMGHTGVLGYESFIIGGENNTIDCGSGAGFNNNAIISSQISHIGGLATFGTIIGGTSCHLDTGDNSAILGGLCLTNRGVCSVTLGAYGTVRDGDDYTFVWSDGAFGNNGQFTSTGQHQFLVHALVGIGTNNPHANRLAVLGASEFIGTINATNYTISGLPMASKAYVDEALIGIVGSTNGITALMATNIAESVYSDNSAGYINSQTGTNIAQGVYSNNPSGYINLQSATNVAQSIYSNNPAGYVDHSITNGLGGGTGAAQTPWSTNINAAGFNLTGAGTVSAANLVGTVGTSNLVGSLVISNLVGDIGATTNFYAMNLNSSNIPAGKTIVSDGNGKFIATNLLSAPPIITNFALITVTNGVTNVFLEYGSAKGEMFNYDIHSSGTNYFFVAVTNVNIISGRQSLMSSVDIANLATNAITFAFDSRIAWVGTLPPTNLAADTFGIARIKFTTGRFVGEWITGSPAWTFAGTTTNPPIVMLPEDEITTVLLSKRIQRVRGLTYGTNAPARVFAFNGASSGVTNGGIFWSCTNSDAKHWTNHQSVDMSCTALYDVTTDGTNNIFAAGDGHIYFSPGLSLTAPCVNVGIATNTKAFYAALYLRGRYFLVGDHITATALAGSAGTTNGWHITDQPDLIWNLATDQTNVAAAGSHKIYITTYNDGTNWTATYSQQMQLNAQIAYGIYCEPKGHFYVVGTGGWVTWANNYWALQNTNGWHDIYFEPKPGFAGAASDICMALMDDGYLWGATSYPGYVSYQVGPFNADASTDLFNVMLKAFNIRYPADYTRITTSVTPFGNNIVVGTRIYP